jgi:hypothetical protein
MSLEITLRVYGLEHSYSTQDLPSQRLVKLLQELDGVLGVRYNPETCRFAVCYNPNRTTIFRILSRIELAGRRTGLDYRPTDVRTSQDDSFASPNPHIAPDGTPQPEETAHPALSERS